MSFSFSCISLSLRVTMSRAVSASSQSRLKFWTISLMLFYNFQRMPFSFCRSSWHLVSSSFSYRYLQQGSPLAWFSWSSTSRQFLMRRFSFSSLSLMMLFSKMDTLFLRLIFSLQSSLMVTHRSIDTLSISSSFLRCWLLGLVMREFSLRSASTFSSSTSRSTSLMQPSMASLVTGYSSSATFLASIFFMRSVMMCLDFWFSRSLQLLTRTDFSSFLLLPFSCRLWNFLSISSIFSGPMAGLLCFSLFLASRSSFCLSKACARMLITSVGRSSLARQGFSSSSFFFFLALMGIRAGSCTSSSKYMLQYYNY